MLTNDIREEVVNSVTISLKDFDKKSLDQIRDILYIVLNKYEIQERCTSLATIDTTAEDYLKAFIISKRIEGMSDQTLERYYSENLKLIQTVGKPLSEFTTNDLRYYLALKRNRDHNCNKTLEGIRHCWSSFFGWLTKEEIIEKNPCLKLAQIKCEKQVKKAFSAIEIDKIKRSCMDNNRDLALIDFLDATGCRVSEVSNIDVTDVNFEKNEVLIRHAKGSKQRIVYITDVAALHLKEYLMSRKIASTALFTSKAGKRLSKNGIEAMCKRLETKSGVINIHPHRWRRTFVTRALSNGMPLQYVSLLVGHTSYDTTKIYFAENQEDIMIAYRKYVA